jgi:hypothetical protein
MWKGNTNESVEYGMKLLQRESILILLAPTTKKLVKYDYSHRIGYDYNHMTGYDCSPMTRYD